MKNGFFSEHWNDAGIFREPDGACYTSFESRVPIEFPYTPERTYVDVDDADGLA